MKIISPNVTYIPQLKDIEGMLKHIEFCGRTCYKSEDKITEDSAKGFVQRMIESNHTAMLEHGTVYLTMRTDRNEGSEPSRATWYKNNELVKQRELFGYVQRIFKENPYSIVNLHHDQDTDETTMCITTNYRVIIENHWEDLMQQLFSEPTEWHTPRITLKFVTNIGVTREGNRMRANSIAEESTRYCNYSKDKFGNEITFCKPIWINNDDIPEWDESQWLDCIKDLLNDGKDPQYLEDNPIFWYGMSITFAQCAYRNLIRLGWKPQQAREVLPLATKSEVVYTAFPYQWRHFFDLRLFGTTGIPHPNMKAIATLARNILCANNLWYLIYKPDEPEFSTNQVKKIKLFNI